MPPDLLAISFDAGLRASPPRGTQLIAGFWMGARSNRPSRSRRDRRPGKFVPNTPPEETLGSRDVKPAEPREDEKPAPDRRVLEDSRGLAIERRASSIPPAQLHAVFEVSAEPTPAHETPPPPAFSTRPPPRAPARMGPHARLSKPPAPPRPSARPLPVEHEEDSIETRFSLLSSAAVPVLAAPPTDTAAPPPASPRPKSRWLAIAAAAALIVVAGIVVGARTRDTGPSARRPSEPSGEKPVSNPLVAAPAPAPTPVLELPTEPPGTPPEAAEAAKTPENPDETPETTGVSQPFPPLVPASLPLSSGVQSPPTPSPAPQVAARSDASAADLPPFDSAAASAAISSALERASSCRTPSDPSGALTATLTYAPSGRVTTALVTGPFAGTPVGGCVAGHLRSARVPAFSGQYTTVRRSTVLK